MESELAQGPLANLWVGAGLIAFYIALIWINSLLGLFLTPLFIFPATWLMKQARGPTRTVPATAGAAPSVPPREPPGRDHSPTRPSRT